MKRYFAPFTKARTWTETLHLLLDLPLGIAWFTIVVGLSMDYEVFLLSRVREEYAHTADAVESVVMTRAVAARPSATDSTASLVRAYSSRTRDSRNTS